MAREPPELAVTARLRSRLAAAGRWLVPSGACACAGALAGGAVEGLGLGGAWAAAAAVGFVGLALVPALLAASAAARGVYALWQPEALAAALVDDGGAAPRLAGWAGFLYLAALALAWAMFQGTWLLASWTAFKPLPLGYAMPVLAAGAALVLIGLSRPTAHLLAWIAGAADRRWRRGDRRRTLLRPRAILAGTAALALATAYALWRITVRPRLAPLDVSILYAPAAALAATAAAHALWRRAPRRARAIAGGAAAALAAAALAAALAAARTDPSVTLEIWSRRPLAGLAIEQLFDLDAIRDDLPMGAISPAARPGAAHPDVVLVTLDAVRADRTPLHGGPAEMPVLRALGQRGAVFERAYAPSSAAPRAIPSLITGVQADRVRGRPGRGALRLDPRHVVLAERLRAAGYETAGFVCCRDRWGREARTGLARGLEHLAIEPDGERLARDARAWLEARERAPRGRPLLLWLHLEPRRDARAPRGVHDAERRRLHDLALARADASLAAVVGAFAARPQDRAPIFLVTADRGEGAADRGHATDLHDASLRVPLVIAGPGIAPRRVAEVVSLVDLTPTVVELAGFEPPAGPGIDGRSIADLAEGRRPGDPDGGVAFAAAIGDRARPGDAAALVRGRWKLIEGGAGLELYDLRADPGERANALERNPAIAAQLTRLLRERQALGRRSPFP